MALAGVGSLAVILVLAATTALIWNVGRGSNGSTALTVDEPQTPTPRAISFANAANDSGNAEPPGPATTDETIVLDAATPALMSVEIDAGVQPDGDPLFEAAAAPDFVPLASGSWSGKDPGLVNAGDQAVAERWLSLAAVPAPSFAIEAEIRVVGVLETVCDQSFGIAGGSPGSDLVFGAGIIFPCSGEPPRARLTNVALWEDGYNTDPVIADEDFDPDGGWHRYRFDIRADQLSLEIDGEAMVNGTADSSISPSAADAEVGIWSQGVGLEVRRVAVFGLPLE